MKKILLILLTVWSVHVLAQSTSVNWSTFSSGSAYSVSSNSRVQSAVGQNFVGKSQHTSTQVISGFLVDTVFHGGTVGVEKPSTLQPVSYSLDQNYPNPFNPSTTIHYSLAVCASVLLKVYNMLGQVVAILVDETIEPGDHIISWDASKASTGVYFYQLQTRGLGNSNERFSQVHKMLLVK